MSDDRATIPFLAEARSGDRVALGKLAGMVWDRVYSFAFRTTLDHNGAEDVVQETLLAMLCRLGALRDNRRFWPWVYRIAWSKIQNGHRDRRLRSSLETRRLDAVRRDGASNDTPLDVQVRGETLEQVTVAVSRLSPEHRDILELRCYDQLDYGEIAARTRTTPAQARTRFHRAKHSLKTRLACCV
ncbi:MAG: sigma-70 family RNA polymerase sigma factor [Sedimentisphaerales bacterium]|nr:sigma-70 family RNA polymerase sigma factor [Sedimentisphaerales bacterium]